MRSSSCPLSALYPHNPHYATYSHTQTSPFDHHRALTFLAPAPVVVPRLPTAPPLAALVVPVIIIIVVVVPVEIKVEVEAEVEVVVIVLVVLVLADAVFIVLILRNFDLLLLAAGVVAVSVTMTRPTWTCS